MRLKTKFQDEDFDLGEVVEANVYYGGSGRVKVIAEPVKGGMITFYFETLKGMNEMFEDAEEPKKYWHIAELCGGLQRKQDTDDGEDRFNKQIGNHFETEKQAEKAVEKLKALTKLCKKGFEFNGVEMFGSGLIRIEASIPINEKTTLQERSNITDSLYLLFGGEE
jgi:hypothetical protein